jgi:hypothetical protein
MTIPYERAQAIVNTETFLMQLIRPKDTPGVPKSVRNTAKWLLRHYPTKGDISNIEEMWQAPYECPLSLKNPWSAT